MFSLLASRVCRKLLLPASAAYFCDAKRHLSAMVMPARFFVNKLTDYKGAEKDAGEQEWKVKAYQTIKTITDNQPPRVNDGDGGLYVGGAGIGYMFYYLSQLPMYKEQKSEFLKNGMSYINASLKFMEGHKADHSQKSAFLLGNAGVYAVAAVLNFQSGDKTLGDKYLRKYVSAADNCLPVNYLRCGGDELLVGRAGYISGALWLDKQLGKGTFPQKTLMQLCDAIVQSGRQYSQRHRSTSPLMYAYYDTEYLGAAHGLSTILQMLLSVPGYVQSDAKAEKDVQASVDYLLNLQTPQGNFPCATDELGRRARSEADELVHWCHGAPGVVYLMAKAYMHWKQDKYLDSCIRAAEVVWNKGLLKKGPGICHGVAGNGYVFLLLYRLTNDKKYLHRAQEFAQFMFTPEFNKGARTPDCPYSLYEGLAGTVCFLADLAQPERAAFPFLDVF